MKFTILFILLFVSSSPAFSGENTSTKKMTSVIDIYQDIISPVDGDRCTMFPSCSGYSKEAFKTCGFFKGFIMTCDRLLRCGGDEKKFSKIIEINGKKYIYDPVENNK